MELDQYWKVLSEAYVRTIDKLIVQTINKNSPTGNVPAGFNILGGYMKEEVLAQYKQGQETLLSDLYEAAKADGAAGAEASGITQEQLDAAVTQAKADGVAEGVASVHIPETPVGEGQPGYSQEQYDAAVATAKQAGYDQAVAEDKTPISQEVYDAAKTELSDLQAKYAIDEDQLTKIKAILNPAPAQV